MNKRTFLVWLLAVGLAPAAVASEPVRIGVSLGLTNIYAAPAWMQRRGFELWRDSINERGGLLGRPVELVIVDDQSDREVAVGIYRRFVTRETVDHLFAPYSSQLTAAVAPVVDEAGFPMLTPGAAAEVIWQQGYRGVFGMWMPASRYARGMLEIAFEARLETLAIIHADDAFSEGIAAGARKFAPQLGLRILMDERFAKGTPDLSDFAQQAKDVRADLVVVAGHRDEAVNSRKAFGALGWMPRAFFATVGPALPEWGDVMGEKADGAFTTSIWEPYPLVTYPGAEEFTKAFRSRFDIEPSYHAATAFSAGQVLEAAINTAKSLERGAVRSVLFDLDIYTVAGRFAVDHTGMQVKRVEMIVQWQGGRKEIVWPQELRSARPRIP